jgi:hypothetical protein
MEKVLRAMEKVGIPTADAYDLPTSSKRFPDGGWYRLEISGVERPNVLEALIDEARKRQVPIHRIICSVLGSNYLDDEEIKAIAQLAAEARMEAVMTAGPPSAWDYGRQLITPEGALSGLRCRGADRVRYIISEIMRCVDLGIRGFLVTDEGLLWVLHEMKENGDLPADVVLKVSVFAGHGSPPGGMLLQRLGASTFNPVADLGIPQLATIRQSIDIPMDIYVYVVDAMGGFNRFYDTPEMARVCAPCYFKIEPGPSEALIYKPWYSPEALAFEAREKVKFAQTIVRIIENTNPKITVSGPGPADLSVPKP